MGTSASVRELFFACAESTVELISTSAVATRWNEPSALAGYTVGGLCGHLSRAVSTVGGYLDRTPATGGTPLDAAEYFAAVLGRADPVDSDLHASIRRRGQEAAADGPATMAATLRSALATLRARLDDGTLTQRIEVRDGITMTVEEYLRTRLVELVVHLDDLAASIDADDAPAPPPNEAYVEVAGVLGRLAALRVGGPATVRSLARRERHPSAVRAM